MKLKRLQIFPRANRYSEVRWMGKKIQWVVSPVQVAFWTQMDKGIRNIFTFAPVSRISN